MGSDNIAQHPLVISKHVFHGGESTCWSNSHAPTPKTICSMGLIPAAPRRRIQVVHVDHTRQGQETPQDKPSDGEHADSAVFDFGFAQPLDVEMVGVRGSKLRLRQPARLAGLRPRTEETSLRPARAVVEHFLIVMVIIIV
jgi:hypothetical protein